MQRVFLLLTLLSLAACQSSPPAFTSNDIYWQECNAIAEEFRDQIEGADVVNAGFPHVDSAPFLHSTRFYDALAHEVTDDSQARELLSTMARLGDRIRRSENANLTSPDNANRLNAISQCSLVVANDVSQARLRQQLLTEIRANPAVKDHYSSAAQWLGLLPLLRPVFNWRIALLHAEEQSWFAAEESFDSSVSYEFEDERAAPLAASSFNAAYADSALHLPTFSDADMVKLFTRFAPKLTVDTQGNKDYLGTPTVENGSARVDTQQVTSFYLPSYTRFADRNLLQLNYVFWFPAREPRAWIDLYSGQIDSLIWRVTLDESGEVLLYDSIHSCGCYHKYYLASKAILNRASTERVEPANIFNVSELRHEEGLHLLVTSNEHYIVGLNNAAVEEARSYSLVPYSQLYNLDSSDGARSLFASDGIIDGSERLERLTLWPTGINNVGAMRQWGTHATGFVARQHFDDATLFDRYFQPVPD
ncbi:MAG: hypothetical protein MI746_15875 [Pseudomonadales bacterium]|nr:hypothetical protein [Pseudomonadales bacterium]